MSDTRCTIEEFDKNVAEHTCSILHDEGIYRHLRCYKPGSSIYHFNITTWPGYLAITGDMDSYVFARTRDMFEFFRPSDGTSDKRAINPQYWSEKLVATHRNGHMTFSRELFHDALLNAFNAWDVPEDDQQNVWCAIQKQVIRHEPTSAEEAIDWAQGFTHPDYALTDFWDYRLTDYTHGFTWCCHAILWAIDKYDIAGRAAEVIMGREPAAVT